MADLVSLLVERSYPTPRSFRTLFFDFYVMHDLWWNYGSGRQSYASKSEPTILPGGLNTRVDNDFSEILRTMSRTLVQLMFFNIADEAVNGEDDLYANQKAICDWCRANGLGYLTSANDEFRAPKPEELRAKRPPLALMARLFEAPFWGDESSTWGKEFGHRGDSVASHGHVQKWDVAGEKWSHICRVTQELWDALKKGNTQQMVRNVDRIMHAQHNNGSIFNRPPMRKLGVRLSDADLNLRRDGGTGELVANCSEYVKRLYKSVTRPRLSESLLEG